MEIILSIFLVVVLVCLGGSSIALTIGFIDLFASISAEFSVWGKSKTYDGIKKKFSFKNRTLRGYRKEVERLQEEVELVEEIAELERKKQRLHEELNKYGINTEK